MTTKCNFPTLFDRDRCCMCGDLDDDGCQCDHLDVINHMLEYHTVDCQDDGLHPDVQNFVQLGLPTPTVPCRHCGRFLSFVWVIVEKEA